MRVDPAWVALSLQRNIGGKTMSALLAEFGSVQAILQANPQQLQRVRGVGKTIAQAIHELDVAAVAAAIPRWQADGVQIIVRDSILYPATLRELADYPPTLFARGLFQPRLWDQSVAIVGTRNPSAYARELAMRIAATLAQRHVVIVSGMAFGIDAAAHEGALSVKQGQTLAILGGGVLNIYPPQHQQLAHHILKAGALISENHPQATSTAARLVSRNRIIAALAGAVIVVESADDGGAMYAARAAFTQGKPIYVPDLPATGNQRLLANGGILLSNRLENLPF